MLGRIIHWVYCLPLWQAVVLALAATGTFFWCHRRWGDKLWWRFAVGGLTVCWAAVALNIVMVRDMGAKELSLIPLRTYYVVFSGGQRELIRSSFMNVLLFYPGGLLTASLLPRKKRGWVVLTFCLLSVGLEAGQYLLGVGVTETDDVLHNTLGTFLGLLALRQYEKHNADGP